MYEHTSNLDPIQTAPSFARLQFGVKAKKLTEVSMDRIKIGYPAGYLCFFGSGLDLDIHF